MDIFINQFTGLLLGVIVSLWVLDFMVKTLKGVLR